MQSALQERTKAACDELEKLIIDLGKYPMNYNHYYTDTITKRRQQRQKAALETCVIDASTTRTNKFGETDTQIDVGQVIANYSIATDPDMDNFSCEEALDCLSAIYKVHLPFLCLVISSQESLAMPS